MADNNAVANVVSNGSVVTENGNNGEEATTTDLEIPANNQPRTPTQQPAARPNFWTMIKGFAFRLLIVYFISRLIRGGQQPAAPTSGRGPGSPPMQLPSSNMFSKYDKLDVYIYLSTHEHFNDFNDTSQLFWKFSGLKYGDWEDGPNADGNIPYSSTFETPADLIANGSLYIHLFVTRMNSSPDPNNALGYSKKYTIYKRKAITRYKPRKVSHTVNLLTGETETNKDLPADIPLNVTYLPAVPHWHPNLTINFLDDHTQWTQGALPAPLGDFVDFYPATNEYYPVIFFNDYWNLNSDYQPINETTPNLTLSITLAPISLFRWQLYLGQSMRNKMWGNMFGMEVFSESDEEQDSLKRAFVETNPYLLGLTLVVSIVHSVLEILAFKNDIQFWRTRESLKGLSVRSVFVNVGQCFIVLLYILDNDTNFLVRISVFVGLCIEIWKIRKVLNINIDRENKWFDVIPRIKFEDKSSYTESDTKKYDEIAFRYLSWLLFPLLAGYACYSLVYYEHRGWYSFVLSVLYGFVLTFGFIMMTPQLFINYKLKSVAHLPWRMLSYKALNTFIDDMFAFVIRTPTLYRLGCLRDDIIFFIFLYQKWIYPIDPHRVNEFGYNQEMLNATSAGGTNSSAVASIEDTPGTVTDDSKSVNPADNYDPTKSDSENMDSLVATETNPDGDADEHSGTELKIDRSNGETINHRAKKQKKSDAANKNGTSTQVSSIGDEEIENIDSEYTSSDSPVVTNRKSGRHEIKKEATGNSDSGVSTSVSEKKESKKTKRIR